MHRTLTTDQWTTCAYQLDAALKIWDSPVSLTISRQDDNPQSLARILLRHFTPNSVLDGVEREPCLGMLEIAAQYIFFLFVERLHSIGLAIFTDDDWEKLGVPASTSSLRIPPSGDSGQLTDVPILVVLQQILDTSRLGDNSTLLGRLATGTTSPWSRLFRNDDVPESWPIQWTRAHLCAANSSSVDEGCEPLPIRDLV